MHKLSQDQYALLTRSHTFLSSFLLFAHPGHIASAVSYFETYSEWVQAGRQTPLIINPTPFGASDLQLGTTRFGVYGKPVALTKEQIREEVVERFAYTAKVLYETGE